MVLPVLPETSRWSACIQKQLANALQLINTLQVQIQDLRNIGSNKIQGSTCRQADETDKSKVSSGTKIHNWQSTT